MSEFLRNAERILHAARSIDQAAPTEHSMTILIDWSGAIRVVADSEWPLSSLQVEHGARLAYRVTEREGWVRVEGRSGSESCVLESSAAAAVRNILHRCPVPRQAVGAAVMAASRPAFTSV